MIEVETIPESATEWPELRLLVEWSSPWEEFKTALRPALARSPEALAGEAPVGIFPYRGILVSWLLECLLLIAIIVIPARIASMQPFVAPPRPKWDVIYYSGDELPQTADRGGAQAGKTGRAGGQQAHHRTQTIKVARGDKPGETVVDAPKVNLPHSDSAVANLLAFKPIPGPRPAEGLQSASALRAPTSTLPNVTPIAPAPDVSAAANRNQANLATSVVAPAPEISHNDAHDNRRAASAVSPTPIAPAPNMATDRLRSTSSIASTVVAPAPSQTPRDLASSRVQISQTTDVVAPPVSAPQRDLAAPTTKLSLPAPTVVAPPPSQVSRDLNSWGSTRSGDLRSQPVPPPPSAAAGGSQTRSGRGTLGTQAVPPAESINKNGASNDAASNGASSSASGGSRNSRGGSRLDANSVVPPPPTVGGVGGGKALTGAGRGNKGNGAGGPLDLGSSIAPPGSNGNASGNGVVVSSHPGSTVGLPNSNGGGAIAMSPEGTAKSGLGGSGGGNGIGRGNGPGSGLSGEGSGAGRDGSGRGADSNARSGISPYPGPGGAGSGTSGTPAMPGVSVEGGTTSITLPSFGPPNGNSPNGPGRSSTDPHKGFEATVEAGARSGGVFGTGYYGFLKGKNYSIYIETSIGMAVMQYSDPASAAHPSGETLSAPEPMRKELPADLRQSRVILACTLDRSGILKNVKVLEPGAAETTSKILVALQSWKFRPAFRGNEPVEVTAILGFGVDTR
ncbi:MAG: hypothetical protein WBV36_10115 [Terriglobales bacterium]